jgi:hypothetical protein
MNRAAEASAALPRDDSPLILCADDGEAERLAMRDLHAICPPADAGTALLAQYRGSKVLVTPRARTERAGVAYALTAMSCKVRTLAPSFNVDSDDPTRAESTPLISGLATPGARISTAIVGRCVRYALTSSCGGPRRRACARDPSERGFAVMFGTSDPARVPGPSPRGLRCHGRIVVRSARDGGWRDLRRKRGSPEAALAGLPAAL